MTEHYAPEGLLDRLRAALPGDDRLSPLALAPLDQFHLRGLSATVELAELARIAPAEAVLDVGSGLGGPSRVLTALAAAQVVGVDLTPAYCEAAAWLSARCGLQIRYEVGNALNMPFDSGQFDVVWSQHVAMNIADRARLYREMRRVTRPGGRAAIYDVVSVDGQPPHFPVPWALEPSASHLLTREAMGERLGEAGFDPIEWRDVTPAALALPSSPQPPPALGLPLVLGTRFTDMVRNGLRSLAEGRIALVMGVFRAR